MTWFKVDDRFGSSRKLLSIRRSQRLAAVGLWSLAGAWSAGEELDGYVPGYMVEELGGDDDLAAALVASGLWEDAEDGYQFHKWGEYQPTREELDAKREAERERKAEWRRRKAEKASRPEGVPLGQAEDEEGLSQGLSHGTDVGTPAGVRSPSALTRPDPTRPDPTTNKNISSEAASAAPRPDVEKLLDLLDEEIRRNGGKVPGRTRKNTDAARLLLDRDGRTVEQVEAAIRWCQRDEFWRSNILSMSKLREKYDQLRLAAERKRGPGQAAPTRTEQNMAVVSRLAAMDAADEQRGLTA